MLRLFNRAEALHPGKWEDNKDWRSERRRLLLFQGSTESEERCQISQVTESGSELGTSITQVWSLAYRYIKLVVSSVFNPVLSVSMFK